MNQGTYASGDEAHRWTCHCPVVCSAIERAHSARMVPKECEHVVR